MDGAPLVVDAPAQDPYLNKKILDQFRLTRVVGSGGMGVVYEGADEALGRRVAVKILHRDLVTNREIVERFQREARIASQLDHPGIVRLILFGQLPDGNLYLVLEFLEGPTLLEALDRDGPFAPARAVKVLASLGDAIGYAHARGIVHRDLKPENIILTRRDEDPELPKVLDFGIARTLIGSGSFVTQTGLIFGTARYISPEGASGEPVDQRGDVYSLGVIAYQLLTGHTPFESEEPMQLLLKHIHDVAPPMRRWAKDLAISPDLESVVMRALAKNPDARFDDGCAFARALREAAAAGATDVRSVVATASMHAFTPPTGVVPSVAAARAAADPIAPAATVSSAPATQPATASTVPVTAVESSGVAKVRVVARPADGHAGRQLPHGASHAAVSSPAAPSVQPHLPPRMELPVMSSEALASSAPATTTADARASTPASVVVRPSVLEPVPESQRETAPTPARDDDDFDPDEFPVVPRRQGSGARTFALVAATVLFTVALGVGAAWSFRLFPAQRRADEIDGLVRRANDALVLGRYSHTPNGNDVEDLTDAVLALDPRNPRALQIRRNAATRLKAGADAERLAGRPERAIPLLQEALRLLDDPVFRDDIAAAQRELDAQRAAAQSPQRPAQRPAPRPAPRPAAPRVDPSLDHPPQPVQPLHPAVTPAPAPAPAQPVAQAPATPRAPSRPPRREGGNVVQQPPPPDDDMSVLPRAPQQPPSPIFGTPLTPIQGPMQPVPSDDDEPHTGAF